MSTKSKKAITSEDTTAALGTEQPMAQNINTNYTKNFNDIIRLNGKLVSETAYMGNLGNNLISSKIYQVPTGFTLYLISSYMTAQTIGVSANQGYIQYSLSINNSINLYFAFLSVYPNASFNEAYNDTWTNPLIIPSGQIVSLTMDATNVSGASFINNFSCGFVGYLVDNRFNF